MGSGSKARVEAAQRGPGELEKGQTEERVSE